MISTPRLILTLLCCAVPAVVTASEADLKKCQVITDSSNRLACYDAAMQQTTPPARPTAATEPVTPAASASAEPAVAPTPPPATVKDAPAPATAPAQKPAAVVVGEKSRTEADFGLPEEPDWEQIKDNQMTATVATSSKTPLGSIVVELTNGQIWQQVDDRRLTLRQGDEISIREGMGGAFFLAKTSGSRSLKVRRTK